MTREDFIKKVDQKVKLIRNEKGYTQDKMADVLGISKKTLVQVEKERASLGWSVAVTVCTIFKESEILQMTFGGDAQDIIITLAFENYERGREWTMGGRIWWKDIESKADFKIQQNIITNHFRILNCDNRRVSSSFEEIYIRNRFEELTKQA
jgi:DNA-binding XRE family transcriptional regulator